MKTPLEAAAKEYDKSLYGVRYTEGFEQEDFIAGANYQAPITRAETINHIVEMFRDIGDAIILECNFHHNVRMGDSIADWLEQQLKKGRGE